MIAAVAGCSVIYDPDDLPPPPPPPIYGPATKITDNLDVEQMWRVNRLARSKEPLLHRCGLGRAQQQLDDDGRGATICAQVTAWPVKPRPARNTHAAMDTGSF